MDSSTLDLRMAGTADAILMVEAGADELPEDLMLEALRAGPRGHAADHRAAEARCAPSSASPSSSSRRCCPIRRVEAAVTAWIGDRDARCIFATPVKKRNSARR